MQALLLYTPRLMLVIVPVDERVCVVVSKPAVVTTNSNVAVLRAINVFRPSFFNSVKFVPPSYSFIVY